MAAHFLGKIVSGNDCETMMLIAQAVKSNLPLSDAIRLSIEDASARGSLEKALLRLADRLEKGDDPKLAIKQVGLPRPIVAMFEMSLQNSDFAATFDELAQLEIGRTASINRLVQTFTYPVFLACVILLSFLMFLLFVAPQFKAIFGDFGLDLPALTKFTLRISEMFRTGPLVWGLIAFLVTFCIVRRLVFPRFWYVIPIFGAIGRSLNMCRMLRQMAWLVHQNVPLPEALEQCGATMRNSAYRRDCRRAAESARRGMSLAEIAIRYDWLFPAWLAPVVNAAGSSEVLARALRRAADSADQQKEGALSFIQSLSMPLFVIIMVVGGGVVVIAMFLPMISLITDLSSPM